MIFVIRVENDEVYRCIEVNEAYFKGTGLEKEQLLNKSIDEIVSKEDSLKIKRRYRGAIQSIVPVFDDEVNCSFIIGIARDISARKNYEEEQNRTKEKFQRVIHHQQGLIFSVEKVDQDYFYTLFDGQLIKQFEKLPIQSVVGKGTTFTICFPLFGI
jgi:hypothetical protein